MAVASTTAPEQHTRLYLSRGGHLQHQPFFVEIVNSFPPAG